MHTIPFENNVGKVVLKGSKIKEAFEFSFRRYDGVTARGEFLQVSGKKLKSYFIKYINTNNCITHTSVLRYFISTDGRFWTQICQYKLTLSNITKM